MELDSIRGALVGIPGRTGLSVEQRKRLTIGVELVANPSVIFMDEPTSGAAQPARLWVIWKLLAAGRGPSWAVGLCDDGVPSRPYLS